MEHRRVFCRDDRRLGSSVRPHAQEHIRSRGRGGDAGDQNSSQGDDDELLMHMAAEMGDPLRSGGQGWYGGAAVSTSPARDLQPEEDENDGDENDFQHEEHAAHDDDNDDDDEDDDDDDDDDRTLPPGKEEELSEQLSVSAAITCALASDLLQCKVAAESSASRAVEPEAPAVLKVSECCICGAPPLYTCPACRRRTCSVACVRLHKAHDTCTGERDVAKKIPISEFTDVELQRDFHFLEDVSRVVSNAGRNFPHMWRYSFQALPPPLHALRTAAKKRGVICQITSEGMRKRDANTSRYDRRSDTVIWRCDFQFHGPTEFTVGTDWASERALLKDILAYCWASNPTLPSFHINRRYNRATQWIEGPLKGKPESPAASEPGVSSSTLTHPAAGDLPLAAELPRAEPAAEVPAPGDAEASAPNPAVCLERSSDGTSCDGPPSGHTGDTGKPADDGAKVKAIDQSGSCTETKADVAGENPNTDSVAPQEPFTVPRTPREVELHEKVSSFLDRGPVVVLARAERLGLDMKYFRMDLGATLNENLRILFFINEFPVFDVVYADSVDSYALVTEEDKERIRESFRSKERKRDREDRPPPRRTKAEMTPEEIEKCGRIPCRRFLGGQCRLTEEQCPYWHCPYERVPGCRHFAKFGACPLEDRCSFRHDVDAIAAERRRSKQDGRGGRGGRGRGGRGRGHGIFDLSRDRRGGWGRGSSSHHSPGGDRSSGNSAPSQYPPAHNAGPGH